MTKARDLANIISGGFTVDDIPNLPASKITTGTFDDARIAASNVSQHATSFDDNKIVNDISTLALRQASDQNKSAYNTNSQSVDVFQDATGIDTTTNALRNTDEYVSSSSLIAGNDSYTKMLLHFNNNITNDAVGGSTTFGNINTPTYSTSIKKFGTHAIGFNGNSGIFVNSNLSDLNFGTGDFTIDFWLRLNQAPSSACCYDIMFSNSSNNRLLYNHTSGEGMKFINDNNYAQDMNWGSLATNNTWHHFCVARNSGTIQIWKDGTRTSVHTGRNASLNTDATYVNLFRNGGYQSYDGYVDEFRISVGVDRTTESADPLYISSGTSFTPPTNGYGDTITSATGNFTGTTITAPSSVSSMGAIITYQDNAGTNALNTDIVLQLSADGGSNYSTATLTALPDFSTGIKMAKVNDLAVTAGTQLKYKINFANQASGSKEARIRGVALQY